MLLRMPLGIGFNLRLDGELACGLIFSKSTTGLVSPVPFFLPSASPFLSPPSTSIPRARDAAGALRRGGFTLWGASFTYASEGDRGRVSGDGGSTCSCSCCNACSGCCCNASASFSARSLDRGRLGGDEGRTCKHLLFSSVFARLHVCASTHVLFLYEEVPQHSQSFLKRTPARATGSMALSTRTLTGRGVPTRLLVDLHTSAYVSLRQLTSAYVARASVDSPSVEPPRSSCVSPPPPPPLSRVSLPPPRA